MESPYSHIGWDPLYRPPTGFNIPMLHTESEEPTFEEEEKKENDFPETEDGMQWKLIAESSPEDIAQNNDIDKLEEIVKSFVNAKFSKTDSKILPSPLSQKLFRILQIAVAYLLDCQKQLSSEINDDETEIETLKAKNKKYKNIIVMLKEKQQKPDVEKCIVCGRKFKNVSYLDSHMERRHNALLPAWKSLRCGEIHGLQDIIGEIENLRKVIAQTRKETAMARKMQEQQPKAVQIPKEQLELMNNLRNNQEVLIEKTKAKNDDQAKLHDDIRAQLDDAIAALRASHEKWITQIKERENNKFTPSIFNAATVFAQQQMMQQNAQKQQKQEDSSVSNEEAPDPHAKVIQDLNLLVDTVQIPSKESVVKDGEKSEVKIDEADLTLQEMVERMNKNAELINTIEGTEVAKKQDAEDIQVLFHPGNRIIARAKMLLESESKYDDEERKDKFITKESEKIKKEVSDEYLRLKNKRMLTNPSIPYARQQLGENNAAYIALFDKLLYEVRRVAPITEAKLDNLFAERDIKFPRVPPLEEVKGTQTRTYISTTKNVKDITELSEGERIKKENENIKNGYQNLPYKQKIRPNRAETIPDDSDIETVSWRESSTNDSSISFTEDPLLYIRRKQKLKKTILDIGDSSSSKSEENEEPSKGKKITPISSDEIKELNIDVTEFASDSFDEEPKDDDKPEKKHVKQTFIKSPEDPVAYQEAKKNFNKDGIYGDSVEEISSSTVSGIDDDPDF